MLSHESLVNLYQTNFALMQFHKYSLTELDSMLPYEREIYVQMVVQTLKEEAEKREAEMNKQKRAM